MPLKFRAYDFPMPKTNNAATTHLLYLHGFRSSPKSAKALLVAQRVAREYPDVTWWCPQLPPSPKQAMQEVADGISTWPGHTMAVIGSSLGGFYASWVATRKDCKSVLLNPAVNPARDLEKYIGEVTSWHDPGENFYFRPEFVEELRQLDCAGRQDLRHALAVIAKGDEVLDWREMLDRYRQGTVLLLEGGDHALSDFAQHLPTILAHLNLVQPD